MESNFNDYVLSICRKYVNDIPKTKWYTNSSFIYKSMPVSTMYDGDLDHITKETRSKIKKMYNAKRLYIKHYPESNCREFKSLTISLENGDTFCIYFHKGKINFMN